MTQTTNLVNRTHFDQCIKCTVCTTHCPVSAITPLFAGPKQAGPDGERLRLKSPAFYDQTLNLCTHCKRCETACPSDVHISDIIAIAKNKYEDKNWSRKRLRNFLLSHTDFVGQIAIRFSSLINSITKMSCIKRLLHISLGINQAKKLPTYTRQSFRQWFQLRQAQQVRYQEQVCYFHGCYVNYNQPKLGQAVVEIFNAMNIGVTLTREKCCGIVMIANGFQDKAKRNALHNISQFNSLNPQLPIVSTSSTCTMTLKTEYQQILDTDNPHQNQTYYITRFLLKKIMDGKTLKLKPLPLKVLYHTPCHMERTGNVLFTLELIKLIPNIRVEVLDSQCCGLAGTYGFKDENYDTSMKIGQSLFEKIAQKQADYIITDCETCKWQLDENTDLETLHPILLLQMALSKQQVAF